MDSALVVGLSCRVGCSTRADQRVLSALVVGLSCRVGCSTRVLTRVLSALWWDSPAVWAAVPELTSGCS
ncbi:unnamed protein product [Staurois parvus]|uniref:Uncharacterized protein n=1 Tax=Staurois parvus TaxID=386267 RepID=A0ABN9G5S1_9NEOB|nr:unnamed protein product [Staurois parvus]